MGQYPWEDSIPAVTDAPDDETEGDREGGRNTADVSAAGDPANNGHKFTVGLDTVEFEHVNWLWPGRIPLAKVSIIEGDPDSGKSTITLDLAARVSSGTPMPLNERLGPQEPAGVVLVCAEDDLGDTILPRILAHGGEPAKIGSVTLTRDEQGELIPLAIPDDMHRLRGAIAERDAKLMIIDPITAYLTATINSNNDAQVRRAMTPLKDLAEQTGCAMLLVRHLNKSGELKAKYRGGGSIAFTGAARSVLVVDKHPEQDDVWVMARVKGNLAKVIPSLTYKIESEDLYESPVIRWTGTDKIDADTLLKGKDGREGAETREKAEEFLKEELSEGPKLANDLISDAKKYLSISSRTLDRAKANLGVISKRQRDAKGKTLGWVWALPGMQQPEPLRGDPIPPGSIE
jgi:RecA-family ATPase